MATVPAAHDPRYLSDYQLRLLEAHEQAIREREHARERRRIEAMQAVTGTRASDDFLGCTE